jgi:hypothetical protein
MAKTTPSRFLEQKAGTLTTFIAGPFAGIFRVILSFCIFKLDYSQPIAFSPNYKTANIQ